MINPIEDYVYAGVKCAEARNCGDEARAKFESDWFRRAVNLETQPYKAKCEAEFDAAYKRTRHIGPYNPTQ